MSAMKKPTLAFLTLLLIACSTLATPAALPAATAVVLPTETAILPTPLPTRTLQPYEQYTIDTLRRRPYGGGKIEILETLAETDLYTSYSIRYPSDGLNIYGFVNVPKGSGPFPVIVSVHGYAPNGSYNVFDITADFADIFAENQFIVVHPGLRNHPPSDSGDNLLRVGMSVDIMNLIALLKDQANLPAELSAVNPEVMGLWGNSLGGEIALRVMTLSPDIKATLLYAPMGGNIERNSRQLYEVSNDDQFQQDSQVPVELMSRISPMNYYHLVKSAVQLHHGLDDTTAPISWAVETCTFLQSAGVPVECVYYPGVGHIFNRSNFEKVVSSALEFYRLHLSTQTQ
jgi:dipeptidyl aminopeptidase/acylaminoacyl peptidase